MNNDILPIQLPDNKAKIYAGFWSRFCSYFLDVLFVMIIGLPIYFINKIDRTAMIYTMIPSLSISFLYQIYLVKLWGATPGKRLMKLRILRKDGLPVSWREAILRYSVDFILSIAFSIASIFVLLQIDNTEYKTLSFMQLGARMMALMPLWGVIIQKLLGIWTNSEMIVLLFNKRKRALHDFIAGTVVVYEKHLNEIQQFIAAETGTDNN